ncbi:MAG: hypothetical protein ACLUTZ_09545 [Oliverpabstia sp.]
MMTVVSTAVQGFEERYTFYRNIFLYCGIAAQVFLAIAIILFFVLKIQTGSSGERSKNGKKSEEMVAAEHRL